LIRTILSPVISECTELPTRAHSLRTVPSHLTRGSSSNNSSHRSAVSAPPTESPNFSSSGLKDGLTKHLDRLSENLKAKSTPALRVHVVNTSPSHVRSMRALGEYTEQQADAPSSEDERRSEQPPSRSPSLRRSSSRPARVASLAEAKFSKRVASAHFYASRKSMLAQKDALVRRLQHVQSLAEEVKLLRELGELYLSNAVDGPPEEGVALKQKSAEMAIVWLRRAMEKQNEDPKGSVEGMETWYLLGRAVRALCGGIWLLMPRAARDLCCCCRGPREGREPASSSVGLCAGSGSKSRPDVEGASAGEWLADLII
jgi:hypothetical protein